MAPSSCCLDRHGETAAGLFSMIKVLAMFEKRLFLPTAGVTQPRKDFDWSGNRMRLVQDLEPFPPLETHGPIIVGVSTSAICRLDTVERPMAVTVLAA